MLRKRLGLGILAGIATVVVFAGLWFADNSALALRRNAEIPWPLEWERCSSIASTRVGIDDHGEPAAVFRVIAWDESILEDSDRHGRLFFVKNEDTESAKLTRENRLQVFQLSISDDRRQILPKISRIATFDSPDPDWIIATDEDDSIYVVFRRRDSSSANSDQRAITKLSYVNDSSKMEPIWSIDLENSGNGKCNNLFLSSRENRRRVFDYLPIANQMFFYGDSGNVGVIADRATGKVSCTDIEVQLQFRLLDSLGGVGRIGAIATDSRLNGEMKTANAWLLRVYDLGKSDGTEVVESRMPVRREIDNASSLGSGIVLSRKSCITYHAKAITLWNGELFQSQQIVRLPKYPSDYEIILVRALNDQDIQVVVAEHKSGNAMWCQLRLGQYRVQATKSWKELPYFRDSVIQSSVPTY